jgi:hypothetical protein
MHEDAAAILRHDRIRQRQAGQPLQHRGCTRACRGIVAAGRFITGLYVGHNIGSGACLRATRSCRSLILKVAMPTPTSMVRADTEVLVLLT